MNFQRQLKLYILLAIISLFFTLWLPYVGEEAVYTISSYEMWFFHNYVLNTLYGTFYGRPPLLNWFIIPLAKGLGWQHVLIASRLVSALATAFVALGVYGFVKRLTTNGHYALLCTAIYLTGDLLLIRGWLAYADPLLSLFIFLSIAFLWLSVEEKRHDFLILGIIGLCAGFLVKALSPYWFYGLAGLVLLIFHPNRKFLLRPTSIIFHIAALAFPLIWNTYTDPRYLPAMWDEITSTTFSPGLGQYLYQIFIAQPGLLFIRLAPISIVALFYYLKSRHQSALEFRHVTRIAFWIAFLNFAVCWFAPRWPEVRYYMPVLPLMAMCMAYVIWNANQRAKHITAVLLLLFLVVKIGTVGYFYYQYEQHEPDYRAEAKEILRIVGNEPLMADVHTLESAPVEKVAIYLDLLRYPKPPVLMAPLYIELKISIAYTATAPKKGQGMYVIGQLPTFRDKIVKQFSTGKRRVYLFYRQ